MSDTRDHYRDTEVATNYLAQYGAKVTARNFSHHLIARGERRAVSQLLYPVRSEIRMIMDIPCGTGKLHDVLSDEHTRVIAADVSQEMLSFASRFYKGNRQRAWMARLDAVRLPFADRSIDAVVSLRLLHRVPDFVKRSMIDEFTRVARHYVIVSLGVVGIWQRTRLALRRWTTGVATVPHPVPRSGVEAMLRRSGWAIDARTAVLPIFSAEVLFRLKRSAL